MLLYESGKEHGGRIWLGERVAADQLLEKLLIVSLLDHAFEFGIEELDPEFDEVVLLDLTCFKDAVEVQEHLPVDKTWH